MAVTEAKAAAEDAAANQKCPLAVEFQATLKHYVFRAENLIHS